MSVSKWSLFANYPQSKLPTLHIQFSLPGFSYSVSAAIYSLAVAELNFPPVFVGKCNYNANNYIHVH